MQTDLSARVGVWSRYWSHQPLHSCAGSYERGYEGGIGKFWRQGFACLPANARVLDLATGNGPLPRLILALEDRNDLCCDGVDLAQIDVSWLKQRPAEQRRRMMFFPSVAMEQLPFADQSYDAAISQWGFEYSDLKRSIPELHRVLKIGGVVQLLVHHECARPVLLAKHEITHLDWLLRPGGYLASAAKLLGPMALAATPEGRQRLKSDSKANSLREDFNSQQDRLKERMLSLECTEVLADTADQIGPLFAAASQHGQDYAMKRCQALTLELEDSRLRLQELQSHALSQVAAHELAQQIAVKGMYELSPIEDRDAIMGWGLRANYWP